MNPPPSSRRKTAEDTDLRQRAQERMLEQAGTGAPQADATPANPQRMVHELQVYQVELQLQNEQLEAARAWIEAALASYTELYDFAPVPYFTFSRTGTIAETNLAGARLLGIERVRLLDKRLGSFMTDADRGRFVACLKSVFATQADTQCEVSLIAADGTRRTVEIRTTLANNAQSCRAVLIDVSERSARERQVKRLGDVFTLAHEGMLITDYDGIIIAINHAFSALSGYTPGQVVGQHERMLRSEHQMPGREDEIMRALAMQGSWSGEVRHRHRNGDVYKVIEHISTMLDGLGAQNYVTRFSYPEGHVPAIASAQIH